MDETLNKIKFSIIIPTYGDKCNTLLIPCTKSIIKHTDLSNVEVIIVANGCTDETKAYVTGLSYTYPQFKLLWFDEGLGYARATNEGMKVANGEYLILLNNDTILQDWQSKNDWINILELPFLSDNQMGITGPMKTYSESAGADFLIFFCVMISKKLIESIGYLDESFWSYGEDTDYAMRATQAGFKIKQVPKDCNEYYADKRMTAAFPIFHEGNATHKNWPGGEEIIKRNNEILRTRYNKKAIDGVIDLEKNSHTQSIDKRIHNSLLIDGWMSEKELIFLADRAEKSKIFIEIGSWFGKSSKSIIDNLPIDGKLYCVDTFSGSVGEDHNHGSSNMFNGNFALFQFMKNHWSDINNGRLIVVRMDSITASVFFKEQRIFADTIFIDASHDYESVKSDIDAWLPVVKNDGSSILCGHDYYGV